MEIHSDAHIPFPRDVVFKAYRDDITKLLAYLPNVRNIEVKSRKEDGQRTDTVLVWQGGGEIPGAFRAFLSEGMLSWTDYASWDSAALRCEWRTETHALTEAVHSRGTNQYVEDGPGKTIVQMRGVFEIDPKKIRGVPGFLANKIGKAVEEFLGGKIEPNLIETAKGVTQYLRDRT
jgi:hypothetical protein